MVVSSTVLLSPGHAPWEKEKPDAPALRRLAEEKQPLRQLGTPWSPEVAAKAGDEPVRRLPGLIGLLQKVVIFRMYAEKSEQSKRRSVDY